jgi:Ca2+-binding EF-hand superfamily protein
MKTLLLTSTVLLTGAAGAAFAQESGDTFCTDDYMPIYGGAAGMANASPFAEIDTDGDGMVSQAEYIACRNAAAGTESVETDRSAENLAAADTDVDQKLTREEFLAAAAQVHGAIAASSDPGPDHVTVLRRYIFIPVNAPEVDMTSMTTEQVAAAFERQFDALDADGDDAVSREEWQETVATIRDRTEEITESFAGLDADGSGNLSQVELRAAYRPPEAPSPPAEEGASLRMEGQRASE